MAFNFFGFLNRIFSSKPAQTILTAAAVVAKARVEASLAATDKFTEDEKALMLEGMNALLDEIRRGEETDPQTPPTVS